jgi:hypothetical protein
VAPAEGSTADRVHRGLESSDAPDVGPFGGDGFDDGIDVPF